MHKEELGRLYSKQYSIAHYWLMLRLKSTPGAVKINRGWNQPELRLKSTAVEINRWAIAQQVEVVLADDFNRFNRTSTEGSFFWRTSRGRDFNPYTQILPLLLTSASGKRFITQTSTSTRAHTSWKYKTGNQSHTLMVVPCKMRSANSKF